jgi:hypothetical protein
MPVIYHFRDVNEMVIRLQLPPITPQYRNRDDMLAAFYMGESIELDDGRRVTLETR